MTIKKLLLACFVSVVLLTNLAACGNKADTVTNQGSSNEELSEVQQATDQQATVVQTVPTADPKSSVDVLLGHWQDVNVPERFAIISKVGDKYQYEDNDGKYPAEFTNGILKIKVADNDTADIYIDAETNHMLTVYQGDTLEYQKKN